MKTVKNIFIFLREVRTYLKAKRMTKMRKILILFLLALLPSYYWGEAATSSTLIQQTDLVYQGAFRLPSGDFGSPQYSGFNYGGTAIGYNPVNDSLYVVGHDWYQLSAEIKIPQIINSNNLSSLNTATVLQPFYDAFEGLRMSVDPTDINGIKVGGQMIYGDQLYLSAYTFYDADNTQSTSHFVRPLNLSTQGQVRGPYKIGDIGAGFVAGYMTQIPQEWQSELGGQAITGKCCLAIISRTSLGPAAFSFNPQDVNNQNPVSATPLLYYPINYPTIGKWGEEGNLYNGTMQIGGIVFPVGSRSVLFFGSSADTFCYGYGTTDPNLVGTKDQNGVKYCYDPTSSSKGTHGYPYRYKVYAYDINDMIAVRNGQKQPWEITPYANWEIVLPFRNENRVIRIGGVAYDPQAQRIFVSQEYGDGSLPVIQVFKVSVQVVADTTPPAAPSGVTVN